MSLVMKADVEIARNVQQLGRVSTSTSSPSESQFAAKMYLYGREICFLLAIIFTSYAALQNSNPKVSKSPAALPFFSRTSLLTDFYRGQLSPAFERISESDVSFIMYYAPWDADSQNLRAHFKLVAQYYHNQIYFAAINCWHPLSECRQQFSKIQMFPVLIAYTQHTKGIQYKGIKEADHMINFLRSVLKPLQRVQASADLVAMMTRHDAVAVGFFHFAGNVGGPGFHSFYSASLEYLETDPEREVGFALVTDWGTAEMLGVYETPTVRLYLWNETLEYRGDSMDGVARWVGDQLHQVALWVAPPGVKSLMLAPYVEEGATLVLFTPRNALQRNQPVYQLLREIALEYYNCDGNPWISELTRHLAILRAEQRDEYARKDQTCQGRQPRQSKVSVSTVVADRWTNLSCSRGQPDDDEDCAALCGSQRFSTSEIVRGGDTRSAASLDEAELWDQCRQLQRATDSHRPVFPSDAPTDGANTFVGLACRTNRTLSLLAMDSMQFAHFARALGVNIEQEAGETAVVIFNAQEESTYVSPGLPSPSSLRDFISSYTEGSANRKLRSLNSGSDCLQSHDQVCVAEVTSASFQRVVMDTTQNVVLMYHSPYCAFCSAVAHVFLSAARHMRAVRNVTFVRIDGENNDLPWEFTMHHYPTIMFLPARRKSESRVFPRQLPVTMANLVRFVLANLGGGCEVAVGLCATQDATCVGRARSACLQEIADTLRDYRLVLLRWQALQAAGLDLESHRLSVTAQTRRLLFRLQHLHEVQTLLNVAQNLSTGSRELAAIQRSFSLYRAAEEQVSTSASDPTIS